MVVSVNRADFNDMVIEASVPSMLELCEHIIENPSTFARGACYDALVARAEESVITNTRALGLHNQVDLANRADTLAALAAV